MPKIKEITISNFRAYLGQHKFSFVGKNGISNLVVIYGPNGFGKTSFFDAVEWTLSDKIRRFENRIAKAELESKDYSNNELTLLSHRDAKMPGEINIVTSDGRNIQKVADPRKTRNGPYADYRKGILTSDVSSEELKQMYDTNLLTQDQIDSFLRQRTPEEKFQELQEFWPQGADASEVFKKLAKYHRVLNSSLADTEKIIGQVIAEISKYLNPEEKINAILSNIKTLNRSDVFKLTYPELTGQITEAIYISLIELNETNKKRINNLLDQYLKDEVAFGKLVGEYSVYETNQNEFKIGQEQLNQLSRIKDKHLVVKALHDEKALLERKLGYIEQRKSQVIHQLSNWPGHLEALNAILYLQDEINYLLNKTEHNLSQKRVFGSSERSLQSELEKFTTQYHQALTLSDDMESMESGLKNCKRDIKDGAAILEYLDGVELEIDAGIARNQNLRHDLQTLQNDYRLPTLGQKYEHFHEAYRRNQQNLADITNELNDQKTQRDKHETFADGLERILEWGLRQVSEQHLSACPMCNTEFNDVSSLLLNIKSERPTVLNSSELERRIGDSGRILLFLEEEEFYLECQMEEIAAEQIIIISDDINTEYHNRDQIYNRRADIQHKVRYAESYSERILENLNDFGITADGDFDDFSRLRDMNNQHITIFKNSIHRLERIILFKKERHQLLDTELTLAKLEQQTNKNKIELIQVEPDFQNFQTILESTGMKADQMNFDFLNARLNILAEEKHDLTNLLTQQQDAILRANDEVSIDTEQYPADTAQALIQNLISRQKLIQEQITTYQSNYRLLSNDPTFSIENIMQNIKDLNLKQEQLTTLNMDLERFTIELEVIRENLELAQLKQRLEKLNNKKAHTSIAQKKVKLAHIACGEFINRGIELYFNKDVINRIYGKIEPHPNLKEIEIKSEISEEDKAAKLHIRAKNNFDLLNPIFYFSTGQVNVLSLSIFLAKAFELGGDKINTVFMDDPVQNLSDINVLSFIDLIRTLIEEKDRQIVISTHDEKFFRLLQNKLSEDYFKAKYIELISYGQIKGSPSN